MSKKSIIALSSCAAAFIVVLAVATFFDLQINIALANSESVFGQFFALFGEATAWAVAPVAAVILFQAVTNDNKYRHYLRALWLIVLIAGWYFLVDYFFDEIAINIKCEILYVLTFTLGFSALSIFATYKIDKQIMKKLVIFASFMLVALALSQIMTTFMKKIWSRQRFRNMPENDYSGFSNWYKPNWFKKGNGGAFVSDYAGAEDSDAFKSFPSGHTSAAAMSFLVIMLPELFDKLKKYKVWFYVIPAIYTVAVALSRIVLRAHFLSDVLFGGTIGIASVFIAKLIVYSVRKKIIEKNKAEVILEEEEEIPIA